VLYLVRLEHVPKIFHVPYSGLPEPQPGPPPRDRRLRPLGACVGGDARGRGHVDFRVRGERPGRYTLVIWCRTCERGGDHWFAAAPNYIVNQRAVLRVRP
jgi:hypothetical protein